MSSSQPDDEVQDAILTPEEHSSLTSRYGKDAMAYEAGGRRWAFRKPTRAHWRAYKCDQSSNDPTTRADASVSLARACLVPFDPSHTLDAERAKIETLRIVGRTVEQALTPTGDHHTLPDGYCLDCSGGCIVPLARENTEALRRAAYAKPDPFAVKDGAR